MQLAMLIKPRSAVLHRPFYPPDGTAMTWVWVNSCSPWRPDGLGEEQADRWFVVGGVARKPAGPPPAGRCCQLRVDHRDQTAAVHSPKPQNPRSASSGIPAAGRHLDGSPVTGRRQQPADRELTQAVPPDYGLPGRGDRVRFGPLDPECVACLCGIIRS